MNELKHLAEFKKILADYHISNSSQQILKETNLTLLLAPTAGGRNTVIKGLLKKGGYHYIVSDTTRKPRVNDGGPEHNGVEYWFRTEQEMLEDLRKGSFLEAEVIHNQQVSGISIRELRKAQKDNKIAITDIEIGGAEHILKTKPKTLVILVLPPSFEEWQRRIFSRGSMEKSEFKRRMETADKIFTAALTEHNFVLVVNDDLPAAIEQIDHIARTGKVDRTSQKRAEKLVQELALQTKKLLSRS